METFSALLALCVGNSPVTGEFPVQRPVTGSFGVFFDLSLNKRLSKYSWGWWFETLSRSLCRHCNGAKYGVCFVDPSSDWYSAWVLILFKQYLVMMDRVITALIWWEPPVHQSHIIQWRHNDHDSVSNHQPHGCLLNRLFRRRSKKTSKLRVTGLCVGNSPGPVNSPHKGPVTQRIFPFDDVIMKWWPGMSAVTGYVIWYVVQSAIWGLRKLTAFCRLQNAFT